MSNSTLESIFLRLTSQHREVARRPSDPSIAEPSREGRDPEKDGSEASAGDIEISEEDQDPVDSFLGKFVNDLAPRLVLALNDEPADDGEREARKERWRSFSAAVDEFAREESAAEIRDLAWAGDRGGAEGKHEGDLAIDDTVFEGIERSNRESTCVMPSPSTPPCPPLRPSAQERPLKRAHTHTDSQLQEICQS